METLFTKFGDNLIFICDSNERLNIDSINFLLCIESIEHFYFINPLKGLEEHFKANVPSKFFTFLSDIKEIPIEHIRKNNLIICGVKPVDRDAIIVIQKNTKMATIFFQSIGLLSQLWKKKSDINIIEQSFESYIEQYLETKAVFAPEIDILKTDYFVNRGNEIDLHTRTPHKRGFKIVGMVGIGKRAFVNELKKNYGLNTNCIEYYFSDKTDSLSDVLLALLSKLGIKHNEIEIRKTKLKKGKVIPRILTEIFERFDGLPNARIVFYNVDEIYDVDNKKFFKDQLEIFFSSLTNRTSFSGNKVYYISNVDFYLSDIEDRSLQTIHLSKLAPFHIKLIVSQGFSEQNKSEWAKIIRDIDDAIIEELIVGHPYIAQLFVRVSIEVGMEKILNDKDFRRYFDKEHKVKYLMSKIILNEKEIKILSYLSFFKDEIDINFLEKISTNIPEDISSLRNKFLLEVIELKNGGAKYYIPELIKSYIASKCTEIDIKKIHSDIGDFYWNKAEKFNIDKYEMIVSYKNAFYHYSNSDNEEKKSQLILRFKDKFLDQGRQYFYNRYFLDSWLYYNELYINNDLDNANDLSNYLESELYTTKNIILLGEKIDKAIELYPNSEVILVVYAKYLYKAKEYTESIKICRSLIGNKYPSGIYKINNLLPKVLYKKGELSESKRLVELWIKKLEAHEFKDNAIIMQLISNYSLLITLDTSKIKIKNLSKEIFYSLGENFNIDYVYILDDVTNLTPEIISLYKKSNRHKKSLLNTFADYIKTKKLTEDISKNYNVVEITKEGVENDFSEFESIEEDLEEASRLVLNILEEINSNIFFLDVENVSLEKSMLNLESSITQIDAVIKIFDKIKKYDYNFSLSLLNQYISRLKMKEYLLNLSKILEKALKKKVPRNLLFVEGNTDKIILEKALQAFCKKDIQSIEIINCKGSNKMYSEVMSWVHKPVENGRSYVLLDNDYSGQNIYNQLIEDDFFNTQRSKKRIQLKMITSEKLKIFYKIGLIVKRQPNGESNRDFPFELEHLFSLKVWKYANEKGWLDQRSTDECRTIMTLFRTGLNVTLEDFIKSKLLENSIDLDYALFFTHLVKNQHKEDLCKYLLNLDEIEMIEDFKSLVDEICNFLLEDL